MKIPPRDYHASVSYCFDDAILALTLVAWKVVCLSIEPQTLFRISLPESETGEAAARPRSGTR